MSGFLDTLRGLLRRQAAGGHIKGPSHADDSILVRISPGYVSSDNGNTWRAERGGSNP